jgi:hypothetical protein
MATNKGNTILDTNVHVRGTLSADQFTIPDSAVGDDQIKTGDPVAATKLQNRQTKTYGQPGGSVSTTERRIIHTAQAAGSVVSFQAGSRTANVGAATITADLQKNGVSVLSAVITLDNANVAYTPEAGTVTTTAYVAGDVFEVVLTATAGGGTLGNGAYATAVFDENPV